VNIDALQEVILAISEQRSVDAILLQITEHLGQALTATIAMCVPISASVCISWPAPES
jgi:hypothetical protein